MNLHKKVIAGVILAGALLVTGCASGPKSEIEGGEPGTYTREVTVRLKDGRSMPCVVFEKGISCDWANAKRV